MKQQFFLFAVIILTLVSFQSAFADVKVRSKQSMAGQTYENTTYIKGKRQRTDAMGGSMVNITQCDLRRAIQMNPSTKTFVVNEFGEIETTGKSPVNTKTNVPVTKGGRIVTTINIKDTGERKQMFGFQARRLIISMDTKSSPDACSKTNSRMETDGWYIDFEQNFDCGQTLDPRNYGAKNGGGCQDKFEMKQTGSGTRGFPVYEKMTMFDESGKEVMSMLTEVVELSRSQLDAALFDVPADYREVSDPSQLYAAAATPQATRGSNLTQPTVSGMQSPVQVTNAAASAPAPPVPAKPAGTTRIGLATVKTGAVGDRITAAELANAVQNTLTVFLKMPNVEVVAIDARLASAREAEAKEKECDFVIDITASHKKGGGGFGKMFGSALGSAIARTGIGHTGSTVGNIAGQVATQALISATSVSSNIKSKDEITLDLDLSRVGGGPALSKQFKVKARSDGDDIISQVVEQAAQSIAASIGR